MTTERFAPSPTGRLHLGHAFSALTAHEAARKTKGRFLLRLEDLDAGRVRLEFEEGILEDLAWLGIEWDEPPLRQSARADAYATVLSDLKARGLAYPCFCTRREIGAAAPQEGAPDGPAYPGTCRHAKDAEARAAREPHALRLDMRRAIAALGGQGVVRKLSFKEVGTRKGKHLLDPAALTESTGDVVLGRKDGAAAYHLAVVLDDAFQQVSHVTRGEDLFDATPLHRLIQALLGRPTPIYRHHRLIRDEAGRRLAKRDDARSLATLRAEGVAAAEVRNRLGFK